MKETELYEPVRRFLEDGGMRVRAEVMHCDLAAALDDMLTVVELKTTLNLEVILQAVDRQLTADFVYIAVPRKERALKSERWRRLVLLLRRLELGLLLVSHDGERRVEAVLQPVPYDLKAGRSQRAKLRRKMMKELMERVTDANTGGSSRTGILTLYREKALKVLALLCERGEATPAELRRLGADERMTQPILYDNHYRWFEQAGRGRYRVSEDGCRAAEEWSGVIAQIACGTTSKSHAQCPENECDKP